MDYVITQLMYRLAQICPLTPSTHIAFLHISSHIHCELQLFTHKNRSQTTVHVSALWQFSFLKLQSCGFPLWKPNLKAGAFCWTLCYGSMDCGLGSKFSPTLWQSLPVVWSHTWVPMQSHSTRFVRACLHQWPMNAHSLTGTFSCFFSNWTYSQPAWSHTTN